MHLYTRKEEKPIDFRFFPKINFDITKSPNIPTTYKPAGQSC